jgi:cytochrome bd ubiquinol oxidase subunit II
VDIPFILAGVIAFAVTLYVLLDGFDLGLGILLPFVPEPDRRARMIASVAPVWDGNQTWLVLAGTVLFGAFPRAFSLLLPALYLPMTVMLIALGLRGVVFGLRGKTRGGAWWDRGFALGSMLAAFCQGVIAGTYVQGFTLVDGRISGGSFLWLTPFSLITGAAVIVAYALLGACWLIYKTDGNQQVWAREVAARLVWIGAGFIALVCVWTPLAEPAIARRWLSWPNPLFLSPVPLLTGLTIWGFTHALRSKRELAPFVLCVWLYVLTLAGLAISLWPYVVPRHLSIWEVAAPLESQQFLLVGVTIIVPLVLAYTSYTYHVFRGKASVAEGYH